MLYAYQQQPSFCAWRAWMWRCTSAHCRHTHLGHTPKTHSLCCSHLAPSPSSQIQHPQERPAYTAHMLLHALTVAATTCFGRLLQVMTDTDNDTCMHARSLPPSYHTSPWMQQKSQGIWDCCFLIRARILKTNQYVTTWYSTWQYAWQYTTMYVTTYVTVHMTIHIWQHKTSGLSQICCHIAKPAGGI